MGAAMASSGCLDLGGDGESGGRSDTSDDSTTLESDASGAPSGTLPVGEDSAESPETRAGTATGTSGPASSSPDRADGPTDWPGFQMTAANTGVNAAGSPDGPVGVKFAIDGTADAAAPIVVDGVLYFGRRDGTVSAHDAETGQKRWEFTTGSDIWHSPTYVDGVIYVASYDSNLYALDAATGKERWRVSTPRAIHASPMVAAGTVYVGGGMELAAYDAATGSEQWVTGVRGTTQTAAVRDGTVYYAGISRHVYAFDAASGDQMWEYSLQTGGGFTPPAVVPAPDGVDAETLVVFGDSTYEDARVYALDGATGDEVWTVPRDGYVRASPAADRDTVYVADRGDTVAALDLATGEQRWSTDVGGYVEGAVAVSASAVHVCNVHGRLFSVARDSGKLRWTHDLGTRFSEAIAVADDTVYVPAGSRLVALADAQTLFPTTTAQTADIQ